MPPITPPSSSRPTDSLPCQSPSISAIKKHEGLKYSGDVADAAYLAHLLRLGLLAEGYIYPREQRGARDLARKRLQLVRYRTAQECREPGRISAPLSHSFIGKITIGIFRRCSRRSS